MPYRTTFEACSLSAFTKCPVSANARFADNFLAVRLRTPFKIFVLAYPDIVLDHLKLLLSFLRTESLNVVKGVILWAFVLNTGQLHSVT